MCFRRDREGSLLESPRPRLGLNNNATEAPSPEEYTPWALVPRLDYDLVIAAQSCSVWSRGASQPPHEIVIHAKERNKNRYQKVEPFHYSTSVQIVSRICDTNVNAPCARDELHSRQKLEVHNGLVKQMI